MAFKVEIPCESVSLQLTLRMLGVLPDRGPHALCYELQGPAVMQRTVY